MANRHGDFDDDVGSIKDEERASLIDPSKSKSASSSSFSSPRSPLLSWLANDWAREVFYAAVCFVCYGFSYYPMVLGARELPVPVLSFYYAVTHLTMSTILEFTPVAGHPVFWEQYKNNRGGIYWSMVAGTLGSIQRVVLILTLVVDEEASVWVPLSAMSILIGFGYSIGFLGERIGGIRLFGVLALIVANVLIILDKVHRTPLHGAEWEAYFFLALRTIALGMVQPSIKEAAVHKAPFGLSFQVSSFWGAFLDFAFSAFYAGFEGKWDLYWSSAGSWVIIYPISGVLLRAIGRILLRYLAGQQDSVVLVALVALSNHIPVVLFLFVMHEPATLLKGLGLILGGISVVLITATLEAAQPLKK